MRATLLRLAAATLVLTTGACLNLGVTRVSTNEPIADAQLAALVPQQTGFGEALHALGAPLAVRASENGRVVLAYGFEDELQWGLSFSVPIVRAASARFRFDSSSLEIEGVVLIFDADLRLQSVRSGWLAEILRELSGSDSLLSDFAELPR